MKIYLIFKRIIDFILSFIALILLIPLWIIFSIIIKAESRGPILFKQKRIGKNKEYFYILKFRTMRTDTPKDIPTHLLNNADSYITKFGNFLRKTSLDELPQIINILKGDMSIIGPRPALWNQDDLVAERDKYGANDVLPGLTGLAQISGRDELEIPVKAKIDGDYVKDMSLKLDIKIFFKTITKVFKHEGIVEGAHTDNIIEDIYRMKWNFASLFLLEYDEVYGYQKTKNKMRDILKRNHTSSEKYPTFLIDTYMSMDSTEKKSHLTYDEFRTFDKGGLSFLVKLTPTTFLTEESSFIKEGITDSRILLQCNDWHFSHGTNFLPDSVAKYKGYEKRLVLLSDDYTLDTLIIQSDKLGVNIEHVMVPTALYEMLLHDFSNCFVNKDK